MNRLLFASLFIFSFMIFSSFTTELSPQKSYSKADYQLDVLKLRAQLGTNKSFIPELELAGLIALHHFPELKETTIQFKYSNIKTTMATRPTLSSLCGDQSKRVYIIYVDKKIKKNNGLLANEVPFNALIGLIGHEYQHISDYEEKTAAEIASLGIKYCNKKFKKKFECETDHAIISRGLGWQLRDWAVYDMVHSPASDKYKAYKKENYLTPDEISNLILQNKHYRQTLDAEAYEEMLVFDLE